MVNFEWYRSFVTVYRVGTISGAAKSLHLSQPAVSQHIAALEAALSAKLFERSPRKMLPTDAGNQLYNRVVNAVEDLESVPKRTDPLSDYPLLIRLGTPAEFFSEYVVNRWQKDEEIFLKVSFGLTKELLRQVIEGEIDCAIATQKIPQSDLEYHAIYTENFWLVGPPNSALSLSSSHPLTAATLSAQLPLESWIAYSEELPIIRRFWRVVFGRRLAVNPQYVIPDLRGVRAAIAQGLGYSVLPDYLCTDWIEQQRMSLVWQPEKAVSNTIWLVYRKAERRSQVIEALKQRLNRDG
ncbi:MAG: LysR family transcriptional regulator [Leptolyngbya foveolarum]|uniref:LysR family transcriptional regulator n=1 Tax=Leptolyngbya foveolarum TaxID=47253 RepID=A0A2W4UE01_9CYAN|nr:MAG: LysR family transcriptional regulator [Leptolyngbya foveolarum]